MMQTDRRVSRGLNAVCGALALAGIGTIGWLAYQRHQDRLLPSVPEKTRGLRDARRRAYLAEAQGRVAEAERAFTEALELRPGNVGLKADLARVLVARGRRAEAWRLLEPALAPTLAGRGPSVGVDALAWYADLSHEFGSPEDVARAFRGEPPLRGAETSAPVATLHLRAAEAPLNGSRRGSLDHCVRAVEIAPRWLAARLALAGALFSMSRAAEARAQVRRAQTLARPGSVEDAVDIANLVVRYGEPGEIRVAVEGAVARLRTSDAGRWRGLARRIATYGNPEKTRAALAALEKSLPPRDPEALLVLARLHTAGGDLESARVLLRRARERSSARNAVLYARIGFARQEAGDAAEGRDMVWEARRNADAGARRWIDGYVAPSTSPHGGRLVGVSIGPARP